MTSFDEMTPAERHYVAEIKVVAMRFAADQYGSPCVIPDDIALAIARTVILKQP